MGSKKSFLTPLKGEPKRRKICVFDIEAENMVETYAVGFYDGEKTIIFDEPETHIQDFLTYFLNKRYESWYCFAHNGGRYDFLCLIKELIKPKWGKFNLTFIPQGSSIIGIDIRLKQRIWHFRDSYAILPYSLRKLTNDFNVEHKKLELNFEVNHESQDWKKYLIYDCKGLYEVLLEFQRELNNVGGEMGLTVASTALKTFRRSFLHREIPTYHNWDNIVRKAYYGGRVEIFRMYAPNGRYMCYDINSMYPSVMKTGLFPVGEPVILHKPSMNLLKERTGICYITGYTPENIYIPLLPVHVKNKLLFPAGYIQGWYDIDLVLKAVELGYKIDVHKALVFPAEPIFKEYVDVFYRMKKHGVGSKKAVSKLLLNSLYGKFAERCERKQFYLNPEKHDLTLVPYHEDYNIYMKEIINESSHVLPAISVHVTALAQLKLYSFFEKILGMGGEIFYCDTDSFFTNIELSTSDKLGDIKLEYVFNEAVFLLPKTYAVKKNDGIHLKIKGFTRKSRENISFKDFKQALFNHDLTCLTGEPEIKILTFRESIRRNKEFFTTVTVQKQIRCFYDKRVIHKDYGTSPLYLTKHDYAIDDTPVNPV